MSEEEEINGFNGGHLEVVLLLTSLKSVLVLLLK